ncbi:hypothetical protein [Staphylococcus phage APTC_SA_12]|nr:MAG: hypothetical protein [Staphylococcus phage RP2]UPO38541.1 hypothetical protein [Staphylococcus phage vB_SaS_GE1]UWV20055.1 hypothetical protein [Staphylococcus phage APTC_SA_2]UWV20309.1 hypothetical protein [Staphylococcus phage APTC_SA_4]UWV20484.1 hypothetical protein [Staphylococcus phage APTC_SA_12]UWV20640.1 hypothetical protein [Staphylococcus phage APTC_SA_13]WMT38760.1 hypothetical protein [Staphylococcus phage Sp2021]WPH67405.1 hypothetical protein CUBM_gp246c [Staphylococc
MTVATKPPIISKRMLSVFCVDLIVLFFHLNFIILFNPFHLVYLYIKL